MPSNFYKVVKTSADAETVTLEITDAFFRNSAGIIVAGQVFVSCCCVASDNAGKVGMNYNSIINFVTRNDSPFLLIDSDTAYEYTFNLNGTSVMTDGENNIGVDVTGVDFGTTNNLFVWSASFYLTYIEALIGA